MDNNLPLLPVGTRVSHFGEPDSSKGGHGKGTIIAHNQPSPRADEHVESGIKAMRQLESGQMDQTIEQRRALQKVVAGGIMGAIYNNGMRCPYRVRWDPNPAFFTEHPHLLERFPNRQYEDNYEPGCVKPLLPAEAPCAS